MSHLITKIDCVFTPAEGFFKDTWHKLNIGLVGGIARDGSNILPALRPIVEAGFKPDFASPLSNVPAELAGELEANPIAGWKILLSDARDDGHGVVPVHVVKKSYKVHQNAEIFRNVIAALDLVFGVDGYQIATVGTLGGHSQFFLSVAIKGETEAEVVKGDSYKLFFNIVSSHNELVMTAFMFSGVRVVCMNTVKMSLADADANGFKTAVKHTVNSGDLITPKAIESNVRGWLDQKARYFAALKAMTATPMTVDGFKAFASGVFTNDGSDALSTISFNRVEEMAGLFLRGKGNAGVSLYDGVNAFTEFFTSGRGVGSKEVTPAKRLASASFGRGNDWKLTAMNIASDAASLAATMKRGEMFYTDKLKTVALAN